MVRYPFPLCWNPSAGRDESRDAEHAMDAGERGVAAGARSDCSSIEADRIVGGSDTTSLGQLSVRAVADQRIGAGAALYVLLGAQVSSIVCENSDALPCWAAHRYDSLLQMNPSDRR